jgi:hypothetical protein
MRRIKPFHHLLDAIGEGFEKERIRVNLDTGHFQQ